MSRIKDDIVKLQHKKALYQLYKAFEQDIDENDEILVTTRGYELMDNRNGDIRKYRVVLYIEERGYE